MNAETYDRSKQINSRREKTFDFLGKGKLRARLAAVAINVFRADASEIKDMERAVEKYVPAEKRADAAYMRALRHDMLFSRIYYRTQYKEYFIFGFERLSDAGRREFVGAYEKRLLTRVFVQNKELFRTFRNKYLTYQRFEKYYGREIVEVKEGGDREKFFEFARRHPRFLVKNETKYAGNGIWEVNLAESHEDAAEVFDKILREDEACVVEDYIVQAPEMAEIHPRSVNTVRIATYLLGGKTNYLFAELRVGSGGGFTDHSSVGGKYAAIDIETGIVKTELCSSVDLCFHSVKHPDSGIQIVGMQVPRWAELLRLADELAHVVPAQKYVGWDLALTQNGWIMVEGNETGSMSEIQMCMRRGIRDIFELILRDAQSADRKTE